MSTEMSCPGAAPASRNSSRLFSFNSPHGGRPECGGFGKSGTATNNWGRKTRAIRSLKMSWPRTRIGMALMRKKAVHVRHVHGSRLNPIARHVRLQGHTIDNFTALSAAEALQLMQTAFRGTTKRSPTIWCRKFHNGCVHAERGAGLSGAGRFGEDVERRRIATIRPAAQLVDGVSLRSDSRPSASSPR